MNEALSLYQRLGGEAAIRQLVVRFYELMDELPEAAELRALHPQDLAGSQEKLYMFLSGWLGGPPLYSEAYGHPRLRARHMPFAVDRAASDAWMHCMERALDYMAIDDPLLIAQLKEALRRTAEHMRNR